MVIQFFVQYGSGFIYKLKNWERLWVLLAITCFNTQDTEFRVFIEKTDDTNSNKIDEKSN